MLTDEGHTRGVKSLESVHEPVDALWLDHAASYRAISGRDRRFDGRLYVGVLSTGVYCRPSCPARTPRPENCRFYPAAAAAVAAGFRACRRCRPEALPGSRDWDLRGDLAARALRAIGDGAVDDLGVDGLARSLHISPRHLHRAVVAEVGASPLQLAQTRRAQLARMLLDQTDLSAADTAFASGFASVRQFNDVMRAHFGATPTALRAARRGPAGRGLSAGSAIGAAAGDERTAVDGATLRLRLRCADPFDADSWFTHVAHRAVPGLERVGDGPEPAVTRLVRGASDGSPVLATVELGLSGSQVHARLTLGSLGDLASTVVRLRRWLDLDADPRLVADVLGTDPLLAPLVAARPGLRVPGTTDPFELAVRAVLGQQVSTAGARTLAARLVELVGCDEHHGLRLFPTAAALAGTDPVALRSIGLTSSRAATIHALAVAVTDGLPLDPLADRAQVRAALLALPGIGPWTADYVALRALGDPDVFPAGDLVLRHALAGLPGGTGATVDVRAATARSEVWRPWRGYAAQHLWSAWAARTPSEAADATRAPRGPKAARRARDAGVRMEP
ncbi:DNA-3-methyladenine glycosylase [Actinomycetota bacterium]|nr:DNA-3-methyladenine glycosylase [Actinomycetota bacterium]